MENERLRVVGIGGTLREGSSSLGALRRALSAAGEAGADTEILDLRELGLPMYEPGRPLDNYGENVTRLVKEVRGPTPFSSAQRRTTGRSRASRRTRSTSRSFSRVTRGRTCRTGWSV